MKAADRYRRQQSTAKAYVPPERRAQLVAQHENRLESRRGLYGRKWSAYRKAFLARPENALCVECTKLGRVVASEEVDHIEPHRGDQVLFWDVANHQALCKSHHSRKTASQDGGFGNQRRDGAGLVDQRPPPGRVEARVARRAGRPGGRPPGG